MDRYSLTTPGWGNNKVPYPETEGGRQKAGIAKLETNAGRRNQMSPGVSSGSIYESHIQQEAIKNTETECMDILRMGSVMAMGKEKATDSERWGEKDRDQMLT